MSTGERTIDTAIEALTNMTVFGFADEFVAMPSVTETVGGGVSAVIELKNGSQFRVTVTKL